MNATVTIYAIIRVANGDAYVGSTIDLRSRLAHHKMTLRAGRHHCRHLQNAWKKYGEDAFDFRTLEVLSCNSREERYIAELAWIEQMGVYNVLVASARAGSFTISEATRARRSELAKRKAASDPTYRAFLDERGRAISTWMKTAEGRSLMEGHTKRRWADSVEREKLSKGLVNRWADPTARQRQAEKTGARMRTAEAAQAHSEKLRAAWQDPEKSAKLRKRLESRWADPEAKARHSAMMKERWARWRAAKSS